MSGEIYQKIKEVMGEVPSIPKAQRHAQGFDYRGIEDFLAAFRPALHKHGLFLLPEVLNLETGTRITDAKNNKPAAQMHYVIATVAYTLMAGDGSSVRSVVIGESWDNSDNASTKAMTDALTTFFVQVFCVPTGASAQASRQGTGGNKPPAPSPATTQGPAPNPTSNVLPIEAKKLTPDEMDKRAAQLVAENRITCTGNQCTVKANEKISYTVARGDDKKLTCQCERFKTWKDCEHIRAVRLLYSTPKADGRAELTMLIADVLKAGATQEVVNGVIAKLCDGLYDPAQLDDAQIQKAKQALQFKLEELLAGNKAAA